MRLSQPRRIFAALLASLTFPQILAGPIDTGSTDVTTLEGGTTTPPLEGQVTPQDQIRGSPTTPPAAPGREETYQVAKDLSTWIKLQGAENWRHIPAETGGSESWVQVGFTNFVKNKYHLRAGSGSIREQRIYLDSKLAADFTFRPDLTGQNQKTPIRGVIVELKVESRKQKGQKFVNLVLQDKKKFADGVKEEYENYDKVVLAIAWTAGTRAALKKKESGMSLVAHGAEKVELSGTNDKHGNPIPEMVVELYQDNSDPKSGELGGGLGGESGGQSTVQSGGKLGGGLFSGTSSGESGGGKSTVQSDGESGGELEIDRLELSPGKNVQIGA